MHPIDRLNAAAQRILGAQYGRALVTLQFLLLGVLFVIPIGDLQLGSPYWNWFASTAAALAAALAIVAYLSLGRSFRVRPEPLRDAAFVSTGIYRWIRHPMYTAVMALGLSMALHTRAWPGLGTWCLLVFTLTAKSHFEDELWRRREPRAAEYQRRVGRFLPKLGRLSS